MNIDIGTYLTFQRVGTVEFLLLADAGQEADFGDAAVEVAPGVLEEVGLDGLGAALLERRPRPDVHHRAVDAVPERHLGRVDAPAAA